MYSGNEQLGNWKSSLKKVRDTVHKIFPRELSPTRMLEKYATDTKKKSTAKLSTLQTASEKKNAADDAALVAKIQNLELTALPSSSPKSIPFPSATPGTDVSAPDTTPNTLLLAGLFGAGALLLWWSTKK